VAPAETKINRGLHEFPFYASVTSSLRNRSPLAFFCTLQLWAAEKGSIFPLHNAQTNS